MRLIDANALHKEISEWPESVMYKDWVQAAIANAQSITPPPNAPLTLDELREMDGDPGWAVRVDGEFRPFWMLVDVEDESASNRLYAAMFEDYGTGWLAYRRRPEEAGKEDTPE